MHGLPCSKPPQGFISKRIEVAVGPLPDTKKRRKWKAFEVSLIVPFITMEDTRNEGKNSGA